jgi:phosphoglycolate phosphatase-like HAD superfamily hydrolase
MVAPTEDDFSAVLFDLDGTLVDSAPDLAGAANDMRLSRGLDPLPYAVLRPMVGSGARGMVGVALQVHPGDADFMALRDEFLQRYEVRLTRETVVFSNMQPVLKKMTQSGMVWGIVTNKMARYAEPLVSALGLHQTSAVLVCGDTTAHAKPHPAPLIEGCWHAHCCSSLGLPWQWRVSPRLGRRSFARATARPLAIVAIALNYALPGADLASTWVQSWNRACRAPVRS